MLAVAAPAALALAADVETAARAAHQTPVRIGDATGASAGIID
jgi:hypothetical protein